MEEAHVNRSGARRRRVLIVDDEKDMRWTVCTLLKNQGLEPLEAGDGAAALDMMRKASPDCVLLDIRMPGMGGLEVLRRARAFDRLTPIIMITGFGSIDSAVQAMKDGAHHYITKPFEHGRLMGAIRQALEARRPAGPSSLPDRQAPGTPDATLRQTMGPSEDVTGIISDVAKVAPTDFSVIISGETGSGKELVARAIHHQSPRAAGPFVAVDCGCIPPTLFESELFGCEKGAYTGADRSRAGLFEVASEGTLFFDEVANLPLAVQPKLLRALQERQILRVGGSQSIDVDARVICATNCDLAALVQEKRFRRDLFFRLNEFGVALSPLRERQEDIVYLAQRFLSMTNEELGKHVGSISEAALELLLTHRWPGNVRELRNVIRRAVLLADDCVRPDHLDISRDSRATACRRRPAAHAFDGRVSLKEIVRRSVMQVEQEALVEALTKTGGNKAKAARILQIDYKTLLNKAKAYGISSLPGRRDNHGLS